MCNNLDFFTFNLIDGVSQAGPKVVNFPDCDPFKVLNVVHVVKHHRRNMIVSCQQTRLVVPKTSRTLPEGIKIRSRGLSY